MRHTILLALAFFAGWLFCARGTRDGVAAAGPPDFAELVAVANPSIARITTHNSRQPRSPSRDDGVGGGFVVAADGLLVTSRHVVGGAQRIIVTLPGHEPVDGKIVGSDEATDVALLRVPLRGLRPLAIGSARRLRVGQWVLAAGSPYNMPNSWSVGIVSGLGRSNVGIGPKTMRDFIQTDAAANLGNSGGPLLDAQGRAVGVMTVIFSRTGGHQGVGLAVPIDAAMASVERLRSGRRSPKRPSMGVRVREQPGRGGMPGGLAISGFEPNSAAAASGLRVGDLILSAAGRVMRRSVDLQRVVWARKVGDLVSVTVRRGNRRFEVRVALR